MSELPVAVIGAGPQGLAAAAHLLERGLAPLVLESGGSPAASVTQWGHVRAFSPWPELVDAAAARLLAPTGWSAPQMATRPEASGPLPISSRWQRRWGSGCATTPGCRRCLAEDVTGWSPPAGPNSHSSCMSSAPTVWSLDCTPAPSSTRPEPGCRRMWQAPMVSRRSGNGPRQPGEWCPTFRPAVPRRPRCPASTWSWSAAVIRR